jgi:G:T/U-mismatch repair DNA glycosylase
MTLSYGFESIVSWHAKILILGSMPGVESVQILGSQHWFLYKQVIGSI